MAWHASSYPAWHGMPLAIPHGMTLAILPLPIVPTLLLLYLLSPLYSYSTYCPPSTPTLLLLYLLSPLYSYSTPTLLPIVPLYSYSTPTLLPIVPPLLLLYSYSTFLTLSTTRSQQC